MHKKVNLYGALITVSYVNNNSVNSNREGANRVTELLEMRVAFLK